MLNRDSAPFSTFPPIPQYGAEEEDDMHQLRWGMKTLPYKVKRHTRFIIGAILISLSGLVFLFWGERFPPGTIPNTLLIELGSIFIGIGIIGVTVDVGLQSQLARDVFQGAFGYLLHPALRGELRWIYDLDLIATDYTHNVEIVPIPDSDYVTVKEFIIRKIEPLGKEPVKLLLGGGYDEYLVGDRESVSPQMTVTQGTHEWSTNNGKIIPQRALNSDGMPIWECNGPEVHVTSDEPVTISWSKEGVYWKNGEVVNFFGN